MQSPLVSVICLSYNHSEFVGEAIASVFSQDYPNIELIVVDDASKDDSHHVIEQHIKGTAAHFIPLKENHGNCRAFNIGFQASKGAFIIDLAADDILLPERISAGLKAFSAEDFGVNFCDAYFIDKNGVRNGTHYLRDEQGTLLDDVPYGDIYENLIKQYFISPPAMMIKREVLVALNGYDESLSYEDFDFWIRSSRDFRYGFTDKILVEKRLLGSSHSKNQFRFLSEHQKSTLRVCEKIKALNRTREEHQALLRRCRYEIRQCIRQGNLHLIPAFLKIMWN